MKTRTSLNLLLCLALLTGFTLSACRPKPAAVHDDTVYELDPLQGSMIVAAHPLAAQAGADVLAEGGNAADAAVCALAVLNVVEPHASGLGGGGFALVHDENGDVVIDFRETAPQGVNVDVFFDPADTLHLASTSKGTAVAVPGTPMGLAMLWQRYGSLELPRLLAPAIKLAENGYPVSQDLSELIQERAGAMMEDPVLNPLFLKDGFPPMVGDTLYNPELGALYRTLADSGLDYFYILLADKISETVRRAEGWITPEDVLTYEAVIREPIKSTYHDLTLVGPPPPATGALAVMETLNILEPLDLTSYTEAERVHLFCEAMKKAMRDRGKRVADPMRQSYDAVIDSLLDKEMAQQWLSQIHLDAIHHSWAPLGSQPMFPPMDHGNTTHLSVWDANGMVISLTQSINHFFGTGLVVNGFLLNNQMDDFTFEEGSLNLPVPGKRPRSSMAPMILLRGNEPVLCLGTPGGIRIPAAVSQILINHLDLGQNLQAAVDAPRVYPIGATLVLEPRFRAETMAGLEDIGYRPYALGPYDRYFGGAHGIQRLRDGRLVGGADPRRNGIAVYKER